MGYRAVFLIAVIAVSYNSLFSLPCDAASLTYLEDDRSVSAQTDVWWDAITQTEVSYIFEDTDAATLGDALFDASVNAIFNSGHNSDASQSSTLGTRALSGQGQSGATSVHDNNVGDSAAESRFRVLFSLDEASDFTLTGHIGTVFHGNVSYALQTGDGTPILSGDIFPFGSEKYDAHNLDIDESGALTAGVYELEFLAASNPSDYSGSSYWSVDFALTPIPEPGTALLLGTGLATLSIRRSRSRS